MSRLNVIMIFLVCLFIFLLIGFLVYFNGFRESTQNYSSSQYAISKSEERVGDVSENRGKTILGKTENEVSGIVKVEQDLLDESLDEESRGGEDSEDEVGRIVEEIEALIKEIEQLDITGGEVELDII